MALETDRGLIVKFYSRAEVNQAKSWGDKVIDNNNVLLETIPGAGRPIVEDIDYVTIQIPTVAFSDSIVDRPVMYCGGKVPDDKTKIPPTCQKELTPLACDVHRFWAKWQNYAAGKGEQHEGCDLKVWPGITRAQAEELAHFKIYTVEQLAAMNDSNVQGHYVGLRQRARDYLAESKKQVTASELADRDRLIKQQGEALEAMKAQIATLVAAQETKAPEKGKQPLTK